MIPSKTGLFIWLIWNQNPLSQGFQPYEFASEAKLLLYYIFTAYYADVHVRAVGSLYGYVDLKQVFLYFFKQSLEDVCHAQVQQESSFW